MKCRVESLFPSKCEEKNTLNTTVNPGTEKKYEDSKGIWYNNRLIFENELSFVNVYMVIVIIRQERVREKERRDQEGERADLNRGKRSKRESY